MRESGAQVIFSSLHPIVGSVTGRNRQAQSSNTWLYGWCHHHSFGFFDRGMPYMAPGLLAPKWSHLSQRGKRVFDQELAGVIGRALN